MRRFTLIIGLSFCLLGGCQKKGRDLSGTVKINGSPAAHVRVILVASGENAMSYSAETDDSGDFRIGAVPDAEYKVYFAAMPGAGYGSGGYEGMLKDKAAKSVNRPMPGKGMPMSPAAKGKAGSAVKEADEKARAAGAPSMAGSNADIPDKYKSADTSGLTWNTKSELSKTFDLN